MAGFYGADVEQLDTLAVALEREGRALEDLLRRLDARLQSVPWKGPDAERSKSTWTSTLFPRCLQAADGLVTAASVVRRNASDQREASGGGSAGARVYQALPVPIPGLPTLQIPWRPPSFDLPSLPDFIFPGPRDGVVIPRLSELGREGTPSFAFPLPHWPFESFTPADIFAPTREALESRIPGTPWTWGSIGGLIPGASDVLGVRDMADQLSQGQIPVHGMVDTAAGALRKAPPTYLLGAAIGTWNTAAEEFFKADFSAETRANVGNYIASDPWGAASAGAEAVVSALPNMVKNFL